MLKLPDELKQPQMPPMPEQPMQEPPMGPEGAPEEEPMMGQEPEMGDDPKKELQKKAGRMSKELADYQGQDKVEVAKYVKGMVDKAADNVIDGDDGSDEFEGPEGAPMDDGGITEGIVREVISDIMKERGHRDTSRGEKKISNKAISTENPFVANR